MLTRRKLIGGLGLLIAAPAIVRAENIMRVVRVPERFFIRGFDAYGNPMTERLWIDLEPGMLGRVMRGDFLFDRLKLGQVVGAEMVNINDETVFRTQISQRPYVQPGDSLHLRMDIDYRTE